MQVSAVSDEYGHNSKALNSNKVLGNKEQDITSLDYYSKSSIKKTNYNSKDIDSTINEWKTFCHQQILKGKLDIIA